MIFPRWSDTIGLILCYKATFLSIQTYFPSDEAMQSVQKPIFWSDAAIQYRKVQKFHWWSYTISVNSRKCIDYYSDSKNWLFYPSKCLCPGWRSAPWQHWKAQACCTSQKSLDRTGPPMKASTKPILEGPASQFPTIFMAFVLLLKTGRHNRTIKNRNLKPRNRIGRLKNWNSKRTDTIGRYKNRNLASTDCIVRYNRKIDQSDLSPTSGQGRRRSRPDALLIH